MAEKKTKRRDPGSGSIYQRADGYWVAAFDAGYTPGTGARRRIAIVRKTKAAARDAMKLKMAEVEKFGIPEKNSGRVTVKAYADLWVPRLQTEIRPKSFLTYRSSITRWIVPTIGNVALNALTPAHLHAITRAGAKADRSTSSTRADLAVLRKMLKDAEQNGHRIPAAVLAVKGPDRAVNDRGTIHFDHARQLLLAASELDDGSRWIAALLQGMRQGECLGLTWDAVNLVDQTIDVSWQLQALQRTVSGSRSAPLRVPAGYEYRTLHGTMCLVRPKSKSGKRVVPMVPWMTAALTAWKPLCPPSPHKLVWPSIEGAPRLARDDTAEWVALQDQAQVACTDTDEGKTVGRRYLLHEARHTCATLLLNAGVDPHTVTAILGHSSITTSRGYQTVSTVLARQAMDAVQAGLGLAEINPSVVPARRAD